MKVTTTTVHLLETLRAWMSKPHWVILSKRSEQEGHNHNGSFFRNVQSMNVTTTTCHPVERSEHEGTNHNVSPFRNVQSMKVTLQRVTLQRAFRKWRSLTPCVRVALHYGMPKRKKCQNAKLYYQEICYAISITYYYQNQHLTVSTSNLPSKQSCYCQD